MRVADRDGQRVSRIGTQPEVDAQQLLDHVRDLGFFRAADSHDCELDGARRVFMHAERGGHGSERRSASLAEFQCAVGVLGEEYAFDGDLLRPVQLDQLGDTAVNDAQPIGQGSA